MVQKCTGPDSKSAEKGIGGFTDDEKDRLVATHGNPNADAEWSNAFCTVHGERSSRVASPGGTDARAVGSLVMKPPVQQIPNVCSKLPPHLEHFVVVGVENVVSFHAVA